LTAEEVSQAQQRVQRSRELEGFEAAELVIEAVFESAEVKRLVLGEVEPRLQDRTVLASNTSTIPISDLARELEHPERMVGLHFFSPVHRMPLVEVVRHPQSSEEAVERALAFVRSLGKTPIVVKDGPGFYTSRILGPYLAEGGRLLVEGGEISKVDLAARKAGFPVGPLELLDEVGIDIAAHAARTLAESFPERMPFPEHLDRLVATGRLGRKSGRGFYDYSSRRKRPDAGVLQFLSRPAEPRVASPGDTPTRLLMAMTLEAVRCLEEEIVAAPRDADVGAVLGLGFPPFRGGPFRYLDDLGTATALQMSESLAAARGLPFAAPELLRRKARRGERFYD
jgi:3-hydroxyacyl-CoA dehydrogenase/enoyl-CoA hydratase/3-hydroxybutyryl-CoA epimerase